jgi:hypothetical protein
MIPRTHDDAHARIDSAHQGWSIMSPTLKASGRALAATAVLLAAACSDPSAPSSPTSVRASRVPLVASPRVRTPDPEYVKLCVFVVPNQSAPSSVVVNYRVDKGNDGTWDVSGSFTVNVSSCLDAWTQGTPVFDKVEFTLVKPNQFWVVNNTVNSVFRATPGNPSNDVFSSVGPTLGNVASGLSNGRNGATVEFTLSDF